MFRYWLQGGRIDVGFLAAAQLDRYGNINTTVVGDYGHPKVRLPGAGGASEIATSAREVFVMLRQSERAFVDRLDFITSIGFAEGGDSRDRYSIPGRGPTRVITDLGILTPDPETRELSLTGLHPGITVEQAKAATGWTLRVASDIVVTPPPTAAELTALRDLQARTRRAHGGAA